VSAINTIRKKQERGAILQVLSVDYPEWMTTRLVQAAVSATAGLRVSSTELARHLTYLEQKGYIEEQDDPDIYFDEQVRRIRLTAAGNDLCARVIPPDPGIELLA